MQKSSLNASTWLNWRPMFVQMCSYCQPLQTFKFYTITNACKNYVIPGSKLTDNRASIFKNILTYVTVLAFMVIYLEYDLASYVQCEKK